MLDPEMLSRSQESPRTIAMPIWPQDWNRVLLPQAPILTL
jgi:hypothetical protein